MQDGVASVLGAAGLLQCDPAGPWAGGLKDVREATALRCLAGCPPQPVHADVSKDCPCATAYSRWSVECRTIEVYLLIFLRDLHVI